MLSDDLPVGSGRDQHDRPAGQRADRRDPGIDAASHRVPAAPFTTRSRAMTVDTEPITTIVRTRRELNQPDRSKTRGYGVGGSPGKIWPSIVHGSFPVHSSKWASPASRGVPHWASAHVHAGFTQRSMFQVDVRRPLTRGASPCQARLLPVIAGSLQASVLVVRRARHEEAAARNGRRPRVDAALAGGRGPRGLGLSSVRSCSG